MQRFVAVFIAFAHVSLIYVKNSLYFVELTPINILRETEITCASCPGTEMHIRDSRAWLMSGAALFLSYAMDYTYRL